MRRPLEVGPEALAGTGFVTAGECDRCGDVDCVKRAERRLGQRAGGDQQPPIQRNEREPVKQLAGASEEHLKRQGGVAVFSSSDGAGYPATTSSQVMTSESSRNARSAELSGSSQMSSTSAEASA